MSLAGREARALELEEDNSRGGIRRGERGRRGKKKHCILMRCGFGGFSRSICWPELPTCRQLVTACQFSRRSAFLSLLTWRSKKKREGRLQRKGVFLAFCVLDDERCKDFLVWSALLPGCPLYPPSPDSVYVTSSSTPSLFL